MKKTIIVDLIIGALARARNDEYSICGISWITGPFAFVCAIALTGFASVCRYSLCYCWDCAKIV